MFFRSSIAGSFAPLAEYVATVARQTCCSGWATVVLQNGETVLEEYTGVHHHFPEARPIQADSRFNVYSVRKTYVGLAAAIALYDQKIRSLDDGIALYLDDLEGEKLAGVTVRHLVTRTFGLKGKVHDLTRLFPPGTDWQGTSPGLDLLCLIVEKATGQTVSEILTERVLAPLNLTETGWEVSERETLVYDINAVDALPRLRFETPDGRERNLYVSARNLATWGQLHVEQGKLQGKRVLPKEIFRWTTTVQSPSTLSPDKPRHGFYWWIQDNESPLTELGPLLPKGTYQVLGAAGSACLVIPEKNIVAVRMFNSLVNVPGYDYLEDIREFGNLVMRCSG